MKTFIKITVFAILCGVIFFPNKFAEAAPVSYSIIKRATEKDMDPKIFATIMKKAENENYVKYSREIEPTIGQYEGVSYIVYQAMLDPEDSDYFTMISIFPSLKLSTETSIIDAGDSIIAFLLDENGIYLWRTDGNLMHIKNSYKSGFEIISNVRSGWTGYNKPPLVFKDKKRTYQYIRGNISTLNLVGSLSNHDYNSYYTDKKHVYYPSFNGLKILTRADPKTFQKIWDNFYKDKHHVYYKKPKGIFKTLKNADANTVRTIKIFSYKDIYSYEYVIIDKKHMFTYSGADEIAGLDLSEMEILTIKGSQIRSVEPEIFINAFLDKKRGKIYSVDFTNEKTIEISGADPVSFETIIVPARNTSYPDYFYFRDKSSVYVIGKKTFLVPIPGADIKTFESVCNWNSSSSLNNLYKDKNNVYYSRYEDVVTLDNADSTSFKVLGKNDCYYAVDKNHVFELKSGEYIVRNDLDAATFQYVKWDGFHPYMYDQNGFYFNGEFINGLDPKIFKERTGSNGYRFIYLYDDDGVWVAKEDIADLKKIEGADPKTFDFTQPPPDIFYDDDYDAWE